MISMLREQEEALQGTDCVLLAIHAFARHAEHWTLRTESSKATPVPGRVFSRNLLLAADGAVRALEDPRSPWFSAMRYWCRAFSVWSQEVRDMLSRVQLGASLSAREEAVVRHYCNERLLGLPRDWQQFERTTRKAMQVLDMPAAADKDEVVQTLRLHRAMAGDRVSVFVSRDGERLLLGGRQLRDDLAKALGLKRHREKPRRPSTDLDLYTQEDTTLDDIVDAAGAVDDVRRVREALQARLREVEPDSLRFHVLSRFEDLTQETSRRALALEIGVDPSALNRAWVDELGRLRRALGDSGGM